MRNGLIIIGFAVSLFTVGGCFIFDNGDQGGPSASNTIAEIDAVSELSFESERQSGYKRIAKREGLRPAAQVHLVGTVLNKLTRDDAKQDVLLALIKNPNFSSVAEHEILSGSNKLAFESTKKTILKAINARKP